LIIRTLGILDLREKWRCAVFTAVLAHAEPTSLDVVGWNHGRAGAEEVPRWPAPFCPANHRAAIPRPTPKAPHVTPAARPKGQNFNITTTRRHQRHGRTPASPDGQLKPGDQSHRLACARRTCPSPASPGNDAALPHNLPRRGPPAPKWPHRRHRGRDLLSRAARARGSESDIKDAIITTIMQSSACLQLRLRAQGGLLLGEQLHRAHGLQPDAQKLLLLRCSDIALL